MTNAALSLLGAGLSVIPVGEDKVPLVAWKDLQSRFPTPEEVWSWYSVFSSNANLGIVTGVLSDLLVVDIDRPEAIEEVERYLPDNLVIPTVKTPRGMHLYFRHVPGLGNMRDILPGVDVRSEGGYVVCPPSKGYKWEVGLDAGIPEVPPLLMKLLEGCKGVQAGGTGYKVPLIASSVGPQEGRRDDALFHAALTMFKGGAEKEEVEEAIVAMAASCNPPFPREEALIKVRSAFERRNSGTAKDVRDWISMTTGWFNKKDLASEMNIPNNSNTLKSILARLKASGFIESYGNRDGSYRLVSATPVFEDLNKTKDLEEFPLVWPMGVEDLVMVTKKSIAILAGETNTGKTAFAIKFCDLNLNSGNSIRYLSTETTAGRFTARIKRLARPISDWSRVQFTDKVISDFHLHLDPDGINIIDYLEPDVEALWRIGLTIQKIFDALTTGVAVICLQKKKGNDYGYGGVFTAFKSELYLSISEGERGVGELKIVKGKNWRNHANNPNLQKRNFYLSHGVEFSRDPRRPEWYSGDGGSEKDY